MTTTHTITRDEVAATIAELEAAPRGRYADARLRSAREALARHDARPYYWTAEHYRLALRDALNAARLGLRYLDDRQ